MRLQRGQGFLLGADLPCQRAAEGGVGQRRTLTAIGRDQIHHRLGLSQTQLAVQECAAGVLAGSSRLCPGCKADFYQTPGDGIAAVTGKLHHILAGVAVRRTEKQRHALVKKLFSVGKMPEQSGIALGILHLLCGIGRAEHPRRHLVALCAGKPHHSNAACARCRCDCCNGRSLHTASFPRTCLCGCAACAPGTADLPQRTLSDFTVYFTTFLRKKIHPPRGFSTSFKMFVEKKIKKCPALPVEMRGTAWFCFVVQLTARSCRS